MSLLSSASPASDAADCRAMLRGGSRTFFAASLVLPGAVRKPATALYAFCRMADDAIDQGADRRAALDDLEQRLARIYTGACGMTACGITARGSSAADRALARIVIRYAIPKALPAALLEGFAWDADNRRYEDVSQVTAYGVRVAGAVGMMMAMIMGARDSTSLARACDLGVAMQLTNIARDVGEDARRGRIYLPLEWLREAGIDPQRWLERPIFSKALGAVIERLLKFADTLYARSDAGLASLPSACRPGMYAARLMYAEIGREVARQQFDSVNQRAVVAWPRKARLLADALRAAAARGAKSASVEVLPEARYLLASLPRSVAPAAVAPAAVAPQAIAGKDQAAPLRAATQRSRWPRLEDRLVWLIDLFERLERRERNAAGTAQLRGAALRAAEVS